jgi:hypothetical protein
MTPKTNRSRMGRISHRWRSMPGLSCMVASGGEDVDVGLFSGVGAERNELIQSLRRQALLWRCIGSVWDLANARVPNPRH